MKGRKEEKKFCPYCSSEIYVRLGLLYSDTYCCNCGTIVRTRKTLTGKQIYLAYPRTNDGTYLRIECKGGKKNVDREMSDLRETQ